MPKYVGQSNAYDIPNNVIYMGDLLYAWDVGDPLTGWTLGGITVPTIAADGRIRLYDNTPAGGSSSGRIVIPNTLGELLCILHFKATRMIDDTSTNDNSLYCGLADSVPAGGALWNYRALAPTMWGMWRNPTLGYSASMSRILTQGQEYSLDIVKTAKEIVWLIDNVKVLETPVGVKGTAPLSSTPQNFMRTTLKYVNFYVDHAAGQVSHWRVRDIRVSRLVGKS